MMERAEEDVGCASTPRIRDTVDGFRFVARTAPVRALLLLLGVVSLTGMPYAVLMPIFADSILHGGARGLGILMAASGLGALGGALSLAGATRTCAVWADGSRYRRRASASRLRCSRCRGASGCRSALLVPVGFSLMVEMASSNTLIQAMVPDALRGRVMSVYSMMFLGMAPFGGLAAGYAAEHIGAPATVAGGGVICVAAAIVFRLRLPSLRVEARELIVAQGLAAGEPPRRSRGRARRCRLRN